jgi:hypothetical protein
MQTTENKYMHKKKQEIYDVTLALIFVPTKTLLAIIGFAVRAIYRIVAMFPDRSGRGTETRVGDRASQKTGNGEGIHLSIVRFGRWDAYHTIWGR